ncbi:MAG: aminodeoxychorismate synthase component I [Verrucomicrobiia bacterium]
MSNHPLIELRPWRDPCDVFAEYSTRPYCVWLDTVVCEGISVLAAEPAKIISTSGDPFSALAEELALRHVASEQPFPVGAAIGYFGYDLKNVVERLPSNAVDDLGLPRCWFGFYDNLLVFDHGAHQLFEVGLDPAKRDKPPAASRIAFERLSSTPHHGDLRSNFTRDSYRAAVLRAKQYIAAGDIYQVNLSQRFQCDVDASPPEVYLALRKSNPAPYGAYLDIGAAQILSTSPECFLNIRDRHVITRPIKGTRPRGATPADDARIAAELLASPKDNAELVMITDLERNDLGRVCEFGSVRVSELVCVETYATVHHLVSTIEGVLRGDVTHVDCVRACFPGGSITGAPKIRAMEIIDELEPHARGVYTGAIGFLGFNRLTHLNIAIRTAVHQNGRLTFHSGGGIVSDSEPDAEYDETFAKARGILNAIEQLRLR